MSSTTVPIGGDSEPHGSQRHCVPFTKERAVYTELDFQSHSAIQTGCVGPHAVGSESRETIIFRSISNSLPLHLV